MHVCTSVYQHVCAHASACGGQRSISVSSSATSPLTLLGEGPPVNLEPPDLPRLADQQAPGNGPACLCVPQCWDLEVWTYTLASFAFLTWVWGIWTQILTPAHVTHPPPQPVWMLWLTPQKSLLFVVGVAAKHHTLHRVTPTAKNSLPQTAHTTENENLELVRPWGLTQVSVGSPLPAFEVTMNSHSSHQFAGLGGCHILVCPRHSCQPQMGIETLY